MNKKVIKMTESQLKDIVSKVIKEQGAPVTNPIMEIGFNIKGTNQVTQYSCIPSNLMIKGKTLSYYLLQDKNGKDSHYFYGDGSYRKFQGNTQLQVGTWKCGGQSLQVFDREDPKMISYFPFPNKTTQTKNTTINLQNCAPQLVDVTKGKVLKFGCKTQGVKELQTLLDFTTPTGYFGNVTKKKVMDFQKNNNLKVDAIVGPETYKVLTANAIAPPSQDVSEQGTTNTNLTVPEQTMLGFLNQFLKGEEGEFENTPIEQLKTNMLFNSKTIYPMAQKLLEKKRTGKKTYDDKTFNALFLSMDKAITKEQRYQFFKDAANITNITYNSQY
jgi:peptidoglycan hydrolase-like protein with peptidoglycan-binding domain